jgi:PAS domain S-box-containing protein
VLNNAKGLAAIQVQINFDSKVLKLQSVVAGKLGQLFEMLPNVYFFVKDTEGRFMRMNPALLQAIGFRDETEVLGFTDADFFSPFLAHGYREEDRWIVSKNRPVRDKIWFVPNSKGLLVCYLCSKAPLHDRSGRVVGIAGVMRDARSAGAVIGPYEDLKAAVDYLNGHFNESIAIERVAAMVHLSASQFQRRFRTIRRGSSVLWLRLLAFIYGGWVHSNQLQSVHRAFASAELIGLESEALEHGYEQVRQRIVVLGVVSDVLAVFEAATG